MNLPRSALYLGFALPLAFTACSSDDSTPPTDAGTAGTAGAGGTAGTGGTTAGTGGTAGAGGSTGGSAGTGGTAGGNVTDAAAEAAPRDAAGSSDTGSPTDAAARDASADAPRGDASGPAPTCGPFADGGMPQYDASTAPSPTTSFFVSSQTSVTGNLGGLTGADARCQSLAGAAGLGAKTWHAYLSVEHDSSRGNAATNARDRIGAGPWFNARGVQVAADLAALHARTGDPSVFLDEHGNMINGQWTGTPTPTEHDVLTGSNPDGTLAVGKTCVDWTSAQGPGDAAVPDGGNLAVARVGHTDGLGPMCSMATTPNNVTSWNSAHDNAGCDNTAPRGGAGRIY